MNSSQLTYMLSYTHIFSLETAAFTVAESCALETGLVTLAQTLTCFFAVAMY